MRQRRIHVIPHEVYSVSSLLVTTKSLSYYLLPIDWLAFIDREDQTPKPFANEELAYFQGAQERVKVLHQEKLPPLLKIDC